MEFNKVFRLRKLGNKPQRPIYQFMTEAELEEAREEARRKAERKLQMTPVMEERSSTTARTLETDPQLTGFDTCKYVFTDITFGVPDRSRIIVVREQDGTLRTSNWEEQDRINQIYFPREGRRHYTPQMFEPEHLERILGPEKYEYILDRNCLQFEPDHPTYIRTCDAVFNHISEHKHFDLLHSTKHYGPMIFHLCWTKALDDFLAHLVWSGRLEAAVAAVRVYTKIHSESRLAASDLASLTPEEVIRDFAKYESLKPGKVNAALDKLLEDRANKETLLSGHGAK